MAQKTPEQIVEKYQRGVAGAGSDYAAGVQNPTRSWAQATVQGAARWRNGIQQAIQEKSFERGVQAAGEQKWQNNALNKGVTRYQAAAADAAASFAEKAGAIMSAANAARQAANALPNETLEQRLNRARASMEATHNFWKGRGRGT